MSPRELLVELHRAALDAVHAGKALERELARADPGPGPFALLAAGKAACAMAEAAQRALGARIARGAVTTKDGHGRPLRGLALHEAAHPLPDARGESAAREALALARSVARSEQLVVLLSGGASALWCAPAEGVSLEDKRRTTELLLRSGAEIHELNTVRRHLSALKGGGLARAARGRPVRMFAVSDVRGDVLADLGSGPVSADPTTFRDALSVLRAHRLLAEAPAAVCSHLERGAAGALTETVKPGDPVLASVSAQVIASLDAAVATAARAAESLGLRVQVLRDALYGGVESVARSLASAARAARGRGIDLVIAGGEPTVVVRGSGQGGRAQELALRLALALGDERDWSALCAGSDGSDGTSSAAGAFSDASSLARAAARSLDVRARLAHSDSHPLLGALGDLYVTGPTETNVADLALVLVRGAH